MASFKVARDTIPFTSTKFTKQTFYWVVLVATIVFLQLWIISLQTEVGNLTTSLTTVLQENQ